MKRLSFLSADSLITIATITQNDQKTIKNFIIQVHVTISSLFKHFEILIIDNGSSDQTTKIIKDLQTKIPNIRLAILSRKFDSDGAYLAVLEDSLGDYTIILDVNLDPPTLIKRLLDKISHGYDAVIANARTNPLRNPISKISQILLDRIFIKVFAVPFELQPLYTGAFSRSAIHAMAKSGYKKWHAKYTNTFIGFHKITLKYTQKKSNRKQPSTLIGYLYQALDVLVSHSKFPLRLTSFLGLFASFLSLCFVIYTLCIALYKDKIIEGWITTSLVSGGLFFLLFLILAVLSEYVGRLLTESRKEPVYTIAQELNSSAVNKKSTTKLLNVIRR